MTSTVILNPDVFVEQFSRYGQNYQRVFDIKAGRRPAHASRRHATKQANMCGECIFGKHENCKLEECSCIHRENEPRLSL